MEKILLRGMKNLGQNGSGVPNPTRPISVKLLQVIRNNLSREKEKLTGQSVWTCCLVAFWGAFRLGELLGKSEKCFDKFSDLLWEDATWDEEKIVLKIKSAKIKGIPGNQAILFRIPDQSLCPVVALKRLQASQINLGLWEKHLPIFRKSNGLFLKKTEFLDWVNRARGEGSEVLSGKSFRSALPSALQNFPISFQESHLKALGRWRGRSYQLYMRNDTPEFRWVFELVAKTLLNPPSTQENWKSGPATWTRSWNRPRRTPPRTQKRGPPRKATKMIEKTTG